MPKGGLAAAVSKLALDVGTELSKDEDVRKMGKKVMDQLRSPSAGAIKEAAHHAEEKNKKKGKGKAAGGGSSKPGSKILASIGKAHRPGMPHRNSHDSGSGHSSPSGKHHQQHRSSRSASYQQPQPYGFIGGYPSPQLLQPGVPAEYAQLRADDSADQSRGSARNGYNASKSAGASPTSPTSTPRSFASAFPPAQHRAVLDIRGFDGYGSEGYTNNPAPNGSGGRSRRAQQASDDWVDEPPASMGRERAGSVGTLSLPSASAGGYFSEGMGGRMARTALTASSAASAGGESSLFIQHTDSHRLPAPPSTPPARDERSLEPDNRRPGGSHTHKASPLSISTTTSPAGLVHSSNGTNVVMPPHGTTGAHAGSHPSPSSTHSPNSHSHRHHHRSSSAHGSSSSSSPLDGLSKKEGKQRAASHASSLTPSQSYDALASARKRIGAGVPMADVTFAARCATVIYNLFDLEDTRDWIDSGQDRLERNPTLLDVTFSDPGKGIKNWALFKRKCDGTLVISVRGTSRGPDWVDDMLCHLKEKDFALEKASTLRCKDGTVFHAHSSFLRCALAMIPEIRKLLLKRVFKASSPAGSAPTSPGSDRPTKRVGGSAGGAGGGAKFGKLIITGHSAGGAVASLLYLLLEHHYSSLLAQFSQMFCITFGSAACVRRTLPLTSRPSDQALAFILRGDPVPRLDMNYGLYLLDHYARLPSKRGVASVGGPSSHANGSRHATVEDDDDDDDEDDHAGPSILRHGPGHAIPKQTSARDLDGETFLARLTELYGSERESERRASSDGTLEVPLQDLFPAGEMLMIDVGAGDVWEIDAEKLEATSPVNVERHEMKMYQKTLMGIERAQPKLIID
ncbi:unnamed protein product [Tilletia controversa]|uniref:Fungal lipase-type domain-containing protein n=1 Tax=Tilletia controversa TaxID=13291 RepID=A0A8X7MTG9_9BASI|nr:hypothetical protein CF328_g2954 [Tilletia controversa]KAE8248384.1 hypothetical protein A4X06_0g3752 [Tilletia controversa]CAD6933542.1 unnamed protein product [Tilletia controversa]CAD6943647.1 unnamed protein product [Tilletia controversa]CAD6948285.1 unnamed protein product [Tilletia controversa]